MCICDDYISEEIFNNILFPFSLSSNFNTIDYYPTVLKGCRGIVFTHGVRIGRHAGGGESLSGLYLRNAGCRKFILGRDMG